MTAIAEPVVTRPGSRTERRSWLRWGIVVFAGVETLHLSTATLVNDWEGWGVFLSVLGFVLISGLLIVALTYGLLVRWGLKASSQGRNRPALTSLAAGVLSLASYAAFFAWAPLLIAPGALLLARAGLARAEEGGRGRAYAATGALLGLASLSIFAAMFVYALFHGSYPFGF